MMMMLIMMMMMMWWRWLWYYDDDDNDDAYKWKNGYQPVASLLTSFSSTTTFASPSTVILTYEGDDDEGDDDHDRHKHNDNTETTQKYHLTQSQLTLNTKQQWNSHSYKYIKYFKNINQSINQLINTLINQSIN